MRFVACQMQVRWFKIVLSDRRFAAAAHGGFRPGAAQNNEDFLNKTEIGRFHMLSKNYSKTGTVCRVTFKLPAEVEAETAVLAGDFNGWSTDSHPMKKLKDGSFSVVL